MTEYETKAAINALNQLLNEAPEMTAEEDMIEMRKTGGVLDYFVGKNTGIQEFVDLIKELKDKYEREANY